jgi:hypothetical protein
MGSYKEQSKEKNITLIRLVQCPTSSEFIVEDLYGLTTNTDL